MSHRLFRPSVIDYRNVVKMVVFYNKFQGVHVLGANPGLGLNSQTLTNLQPAKPLQPYAETRFSLGLS